LGKPSPIRGPINETIKLSHFINPTSCVQYLTLTDIDRIVNCMLSHRGLGLVSAGTAYVIGLVSAGTAYVIGLVSAGTAYVKAEEALVD